MTAKTKKEFDDLLTLLVQKSELEPKEFIEVFLFAVARVIYCTNYSQGKPMTPDEYIVPVLGDTVSGVLLTHLKWIEACQLKERQTTTIQ